jgi:hypothetical protein
MDWTVQDGRVQIEHVSQVLTHHDVVVWFVETRSKYFEIQTGYLEKPYGIEILLVATERTLMANDELEGPTILQFDCDEGWRAMTDGGRYEARITLFKTTGLESTREGR